MKLRTYRPSHFELWVVRCCVDRRDWPLNARKNHIVYAVEIVSSQVDNRLY